MVEMLIMRTMRIVGMRVVRIMPMCIMRMDIVIVVNTVSVMGKMIWVRMSLMVLVMAVDTNIHQVIVISVGVMVSMSRVSAMRSVIRVSMV